MNSYDCIVYGNDIYGLTVALFLARKMRKVLVIQDSSKTEDYYEEIDIVDPENKQYHFSYNSNAMVTGLDPKGLMHEYLDDLGVASDMGYRKITEEYVVNIDGTIRKRMNSFDQFKVYLVRYYPKNRNQIHRFFADLEKHYQNYVLQYFNMLKNTDYTLTSLMIEWGDYSLEELLNKYFSSQALRDEFLLNGFINGLNPKEINAYNFFSNYFVGLKDGFYYLEDSEKSIRDKLINKLKIINQNIILKTRVKEFKKDSSNKVISIIDKNDDEYQAKYFFVEAEPEKFYTKYFTGLDEDIPIIHSYYPNITDRQKINTMYLAINDHPKNLDIEGLVYYFKNNEDDPLRIVKLYNYSLHINSDKRKKQGYLCLDYTYDDQAKFKKDDLLKRLYDAFPKLKKAVVGIRDGKPKKYLTMLNDLEIRKNLSINELIEIEALEHIQVFDNLYVGCNYYRPESGMFGIINQAIVFADKIEDRLYYGEDDEAFSYLTNEEVMTMIRHNFNPEIFGNNEMHINFHIGKNVYFVRTKGKNIVVHQGKYAHTDLAIYTTNDRLSNLLLKKITFQEVLDEGSLKYRGDKDILFQTVNAFNLDDYQEFNPMDYKKSKYRNMGAKILFGYFAVYTIAALLMNYVNGIFIYPFALFLTLGLFYLKYRSYEEIYWFDIFLNVVFFAFSIMAIFWKAFNQLRIDDILLGIMALTLLVSVFINRPVVYNYLKYDNNVDYRNSILFKIITNGLTFVWGFLFLAILVGTYITGERYVSVLYNFYFVGVFLMYYYPVIYVKTSIKK
ncbi:MAG: hypothetical protein JXL85_03575 [Bacilli bacterium]|nr:hypothetical protein [Bacilli bacterium]